MLNYIIIGVSIECGANASENVITGGNIVIGFQDSCDGSFVVSMPNFRAVEADL